MAGPHRAPAPTLTAGEIGRLFPPRDLAAYQRLPRPVRETLLAVHRLTKGLPYDGGQAALADALGAGIRTVQRHVAALARAGFVLEQRRPNADATLYLHPAVALCAVAERVAPSRPRYARRPPRAGVPLAVPAGSMVERCAAVRRRDGTPFLAPYALVALMTTEQAQAAADAAVAGTPIAADGELDGRLRTLLSARAARAQGTSVERVVAAVLEHGRRLERSESEQRAA